MSQLVQYEPGVTECVEVFLDETEKLYAKTGGVCDFAEWLQYFAFDVGALPNREADVANACQGHWLHHLQQATWIHREE